ncbi:MAG: pantoate--beta-alanine ligase [Candidatus Aminicenantaceae bacterium]
MKTIKTIELMQNEIKKIKSQQKTVGFVPTMGNLHEGHLSLIRKCLKIADVTVVSIFVNPTQFGPGEDFKQYPRNIEKDSEILSREGIDYLFYPDSKEMYPEDYKTYVKVHDLQDKLCGQFRTGHFKGVCTIVLKLFNIINPDISFFGQKDAQQAVIIKQMVKDLNLNIKIHVLPIIREKDGLALSSRNKYLNKEERQAALVLSKSLKKARNLIDNGEKKSSLIINKMGKIIETEPLARIDYIDIVNLETLNSVDRINNQILIALAVFVGKVRLIDNTIIRIKE